MARFAAGPLLRAGAKTALALLPFAQGLLALHAGSLAEAMPEPVLGRRGFFYSVVFVSIPAGSACRDLLCGRENDTKERFLFLRGVLWIKLL